MKLAAFAAANDRATRGLGCRVCRLKPGELAQVDAALRERTMTIATILQWLNLSAQYAKITRNALNWHRENNHHESGSKNEKTSGFRDRDEES